MKTFIFVKLALHFCGEDKLLGVTWILLKNWDNPLLEEIVKNDLMIRLNELPFWIDESGSFDEIQANNCTFDYWTEDSQISWLTGAYLSGKIRLKILTSSKTFNGKFY